MYSKKDPIVLLVKIMLKYPLTILRKLLKKRLDRRSASKEFDIKLLLAVIEI